MSIENWLENLDLSEYIDAFKKESIDIDILSELTSDDLKEIGVVKLGHRKIILKAISELQEKPLNQLSNNNIKKNELIKLCELLPKVISSPLNEYISETNPGMKLWFACDTIELLLRFLVILGLNDLKEKNKLNEKILKQFLGKIEMPTLGAWMAMARILSDQKDKSRLLVPEIYEFVNGPLTDLMYGSQKPGSPDTSFLSLRNRLAHGGGLNNKEAKRLLNVWQDRFENCLKQLFWFQDIKMCGIKSSSFFEFITNQNKDLIKNDLEKKTTDISSESALIIRNNNVLSLWPLILFSPPQLSSKKDNNDTVPITQIYVRKDVVRLQFTPIDVEGYSQTEKGDDAVEAFKSLFRFNDQNLNTEKKFSIQDFTKEINRDAFQMVGRFDDQHKIEETIKSINEGLIWISGTAGIGKSFLAARLMYDLSEHYKNTSTLILPYRFKVGDNARCNRDSFTSFIIERVIEADQILDVKKIHDKGTAVDKLKSCFENIKQETKLIIVLDGLDEINTRDKDFALDFPSSLKFPGIIWVCFGRPETDLVSLFQTKNALIPFLEGLPPMTSNDIRGMILEKIGPLKKKLLSNEKETGEAIVNPFIDLVVKQADGLPLYVKYVIGDVLANHYRVLDGNEMLPDSLHDYHEKLINGLGIGDLKFILTPLVALLAVTFEPLSLNEIESILKFRKIISDDEKGKKLVENGLSVIASMLRRAPDPEGEEGYTLFHYSLREHILKSQDMANSVQTAKEALCELAMKPDEYEELTNYLYRTGIDHFIDLRKFKIAGRALLNFYWLFNLFNLGKTPYDINGYWSRLPMSSRQMDACYTSKLLDNKMHVGYGRKDFGLGHDWVGFMENEIYNNRDKNFNNEINDYWVFDFQKNQDKVMISKSYKDKTLNNLLDTSLTENDKKIIEANAENAKKMNDPDSVDKEFDEEFEDLFKGIDESFDKNFSTPNYKNFKEYCEGEKKEYELFEPMKQTESRLSFYLKLSDFFLLSRLCHSGVELSARICRLNFCKFGGTNTNSILALDRLSSFYALWDGQAADNKLTEQHLFYNPKNKNNVYGNHHVIDKTLSSIAPSIFYYCIKFVIDQEGLKSSLLNKLLSNPCTMFPDVMSLDIKSKNKTLMKISDLLREVSDYSVKSRGEKHPSSLDLKLNLANRLYFDMKLQEAELIIEGVNNDFFTLYGLDDERTIKSLEIKGNIEFEKGDFKSAKISFTKLITEVNKKYLNDTILNIWRSKLVLIEIFFQNFEAAENLCHEGLLYFDNPKTDKFSSLSGDRIFILARDLIEELNSGGSIPLLTDGNDEEQLKQFISFFTNRGLHEMCLSLQKHQNIHELIKNKEILKLIRSFNLPLIFSSNINNLLSQMSPREERCVRMRYGLGTNTTHSLDEIALQFTVSANEIQNFIKNGFKKLRI